MTAIEFMEEKGDRLNQFIRSLNISNKEFAEKMGVAPNYISMLIKNRVSISNKFLYKLTKVYQDFNVTWLETGHQSMTLSNTPDTPQVVSDNRSNYMEFYALADKLLQESSASSDTINELKILYEKVLLEKEAYQNKYVENLEKLNKLQEDVFKVMSVSKKH